MSKIAVSSNPSGTGTFTIQSPATNTDRVLTLPDEAGTVLTSGGAIADALNVDSAPTNSLGVDSSGNLQFNSGYGSVATAYGCRAWVNFNGTGTVAIREDGNVSSITDNGAGDYTVNFTTALPDANYNIVGSSQSNGFYVRGIAGVDAPKFGTTPSTSNVRVAVGNGSTSSTDGLLEDKQYVNISIFR